MGWADVILGGGTSYNYKVTAYSTEGSIPASDTANAIAVVTSTAIPAIDSGGVIWQSTQPTVRTDGSALVTGDLWFVTSYASNVPFVMVNGVYVYPAGCYQWSGSAWVERVSKIYQSSAWNYVYLWLYYLGNLCATVHGGWQARAWSKSSGKGAQAPTITANASSVTIYLATTSEKGGVYEILNDIDLTPFSTLAVDSECSGSTFEAWLVVVPRNSTYYVTSAAAITSNMADSGARQIRTLNVSALNSTYDIAVGINAYNGPGTVIMHSLRLIP